MANKPKKKSYKKNQCVKCTGLCCRYFALPLDDPEDWDDFDDIRWYLCHVSQSPGSAATVERSSSRSASLISSSSSADSFS